MTLNHKYALIALFVLFLVGCAAPGVIGVVYDRQGIVHNVFKNSPADKAGILVEDKILNTKELRGAVGSMCLVKVVREGHYFEKLIKRINENKLSNW